RERHEGGEPGPPALAVGSPIEQSVAHDFRGRHACRGSSQHRLANHQADVVGKAVMQSAAPMCRLIAHCPPGRHPHVTVDNAHYAQGHVVGPQVEGRPAAQVETGMMPVAGENAVLDAAAVERKTHMRAAVVERDYVLAIGHDKHRPAGSTDHNPASAAYFGERADTN